MFCKSIVFNIDINIHAMKCILDTTNDVALRGYVCMIDNIDLLLLFNTRLSCRLTNLLFQIKHGLIFFVSYAMK